MTFLDILQDAYDRTGHGQSPATEVSRRMKRYVNRWHRRVITSPGMASLRYVTLTQASVASQPTYSVGFQSIKKITDTATQIPLLERSIGWYEEHVPDPSAWTGTPEFWVPLGITRVSQQPSAAAELFVKSTQAADTGTVKADVIRSNGVQASLSVALTGTTAVSLSTTITDVVAVVDWFLSAAQTGTVTLHQTSGAGTELSRIPIGATTARYLHYALVPTPSGVLTYTLRGIVTLTDLVQDTDEPLFDADFHDILVDGAVHDEWRSRGKKKEADDLRAEIEFRIRKLRASLWVYDESPDTVTRSFEQTIQLPIT